MSAVSAQRVPWSAWAPWTDKKGRIHPLRSVVFTLLLLPGLWLAIRYAAHLLDARPLNQMIHATGYWAVWFLIASLVVTPLKAVFGLPNIIVVRRMIGNAALAYASVHLLLYITDQNWSLLHVAGEIAQRFYLTIGFVTLLGLSVLGTTSTDGWMRKLGKRWKRLHRIVYVLAVLAVFHYALQVKANVSLPLLAAGVLSWLLVWRALPAGRDRGPVALAGLALAASATTVAAEWGWYRFATHIDPMKVLRAELDTSFGLHPAGQVLVLGILVLAAWLVRQAGQGRAGQRAWFWIALFGLGAWVDDMVAFMFGLDWSDDWDGNYWLWQNLAWTGLLGLLGFVRWLLRGSEQRRIIDWLGVGCIVYQLVLAFIDQRSLEMTLAAALAATWSVLAWQTWQVSRLAAAMLVPLGLILAYGVAGLL